MSPLVSLICVREKEFLEKFEEEFENVKTETGFLCFKPEIRSGFKKPRRTQSDPNFESKFLNLSMLESFVVDKALSKKKQSSILKFMH